MVFEYIGLERSLKYEFLNIFWDKLKEVVNNYSWFY